MMLLLLFATVILINGGFYLLFSKFTFSDPSSPPKGIDFPVSVIICAKNESENLKKNIPLILQQDYPDFELILIDDASSDDSLEIITAFHEQDPRVKIVEVENNEAFWSNKKYSLTLGIKKASHVRLVFTDADCHPGSDQWLKEMAAHFTESKQLILGYGAYEKANGLLNKLIRFETLITAIQYFAYAKAGMPYMGVGRNLAYTSKLFYETSGFMSHMNLRSGDDDLFVNEAATSENVAICYAANGFTLSTPKKSWRSWWRQKRRHITTAKFYKAKHRFLLGLYYVSNFMFWVLLVLSFTFLDWKIPLALTVLRLLMLYVFVGKGAKLLKENDLMPWLPFFELFLVFFQLTIFISNSISKPTHWK